MAGFALLHMRMQSRGGILILPAYAQSIIYYGRWTANFRRWRVACVGHTSRLIWRFGDLRLRYSGLFPAMPVAAEVSVTSHFMITSDLLRDFS